MCCYVARFARGVNSHPASLFGCAVGALTKIMMANSRHRCPDIPQHLSPQSPPTAGEREEVEVPGSIHSCPTALHPSSLLRRRNEVQGDGSRVQAPDPSPLRKMFKVIFSSMWSRPLQAHNRTRTIIEPIEPMPPRQSGHPSSQPRT
jgi:hypothetical protein